MPNPIHHDFRARKAADFRPSAGLNIPVHLVKSALCGILGAALFLASPVVVAQATPTTAKATPGTAQTGDQAKEKTKPAAHKGPHRAKKASERAAKTAKAATAPVAAPVAAPPPPPLPPAQQAPTPAKVAFNRGTLSIDAQNSSLMQILDQVAHQTGIQIQGLDHDERVYGRYGPDTVANTLTDLLEGSGYNYVLIGGGDGSPPTKLVLTSSKGGPAAASPQSVAPPSASAAAVPVSAAPATNGNGEPSQPKTPQEIFEQLRRLHPQ
jgi:hypothetical protein